jgi:hypothetical protein
MVSDVLTMQYLQNSHILLTLGLDRFVVFHESILCLLLCDALCPCGRVDGPLVNRLELLPCCLLAALTPRASVV